MKNLSDEDLAHRAALEGQVTHLRQQASDLQSKLRDARLPAARRTEIEAIVRETQRRLTRIQRSLARLR